MIIAERHIRGIYRAFRSFPFTPFWCNFLLFPLFKFPPLNLHVSIFPHTFCSSIFVDGYDKVLDRLYIERKRSHPIIFLGGRIWNNSVRTLTPLNLLQGCVEFLWIYAFPGLLHGPGRVYSAWASGTYSWTYPKVNPRSIDYMESRF